MAVTNRKYIHDETNNWLLLVNACYQSDQNPSVP